MINPKCPKCGNNEFHLVEFHPTGAKCNLYAICCASCGAVVGTEPLYDIRNEIHTLAAALKVKLP